MASKLKQLLDALDPDRTIDEVGRRIDEALNTFAWPPSLITRWEEFCRCIICFQRHVETTVLRLGTPVSGGTDFDWGQCIHLLVRAFGRNGEKTAFEITRTGAEGGLYRVLKDVARAMAEQYTENAVAARISNYWNELSIEEKLAAPSEYIARFGHLLPPELTEGNAGRIRADFPKVLKEHPRLVQRLGRIGRA